MALKQSHVADLEPREVWFQQVTRVRPGCTIRSEDSLSQELTQPMLSARHKRPIVEIRSHDILDILNILRQHPLIIHQVRPTSL